MTNFENRNNVIKAEIGRLESLISELSKQCRELRKERRATESYEEFSKIDEMIDKKRSERATYRMLLRQAIAVQAEIMYLYA